MRTAAKRDKTEPGILLALADAGADYVLLDPFDVLVWFRGRLTMLECKSKGGRRTRRQQELLKRGWPLRFAETPEDALRAIGAMN